MLLVGGKSLRSYCESGFAGKGLILTELELDLCHSIPEVAFISSKRFAPAKQIQISALTNVNITEQ